MIEQARSVAMLVALMVIATPGWSQEEQDRPPVEEHPCAGEMVAMAYVATAPSPHGGAEACPCFDEAALEGLPERSWDLCHQGPQVTQSASWYGRMAASGREGFNVIVVRTSARSPEASCQFLHRYRRGGEMVQDYQRIPGLSLAQVDSCSRIARAWLQRRGGCQSIP